MNVVFIVANGNKHVRECGAAFKARQKKGGEEGKKKKRLSVHLSRWGARNGGSRLVILAYRTRLYLGMMKEKRG